MTSRSLYVAFAVVVTAFACGGQALVASGNGATDAGGASASDAAVTADDASPTSSDAGPQATDDAGCTGAPFACGAAGTAIALSCVAGCQYCVGVGSSYSCPRVPASCAQDPTCGCLNNAAFVPSTSGSSGTGQGGFMLSCNDEDGGGVVLVFQQE